jgi:hypothetical protein
MCVCQILKTTALTLESSILSHFIEQGIQLFCGELGSTHPRTRVHYYSLTYYFREVDPTHPRTRVHYSSLFYAFFLRGGFF